MASLRPKIIVNKKYIGTLIAPEGSRVSAMVGTAKWGPLNTVTTITDLTNFINTFGDEKSTTGLTGIKGADLFFRNGGILKFVRIADTDTDYGSITLDSSGAVDLINLTAKHKGTLGNDISVEVVANGSNVNLYLRYSTSVENYTNAGVGYSSATDIIAAINAGSSLVTAALASGGTAGNIPVVLTETNLTGGDDGDDGLVPSNYTLAVSNLLWSEEFNYLLVPGITSDSTLQSLATQLENRASQDNKYSTLISGTILNENIATISARTSASYRLRIVSPGVIYTNRNSGLEVNLDGSYLACAYAGKLCSLETEVSGTHETVNVEGVIVNTTSGQNYYTKNEQEQLLEAGVSPVSKIGNTVQMVRDITKYNDQTSPLYEGVIVDIVDYVTGVMESYLEGKIGKPNTSINRGIYASDLDARLSVLQGQGIIEAYNQTLVNEGVSSDTIVVTATIKPAYSTNFIELNLTVQ